jgi:YHS domain-containing protein
MNEKNYASWNDGTLSDGDDAPVSFSLSTRLHIEVRDPVCGAGLLATGPNASHDGAVYYFCSELCRQAFMSAPDRYVP